MAYGVNSEGIWETKYSLRMIRSSAVTLLGSDDDALHAVYGSIPIYLTYSMTKQMYISQPPADKIDTLSSKPGAVGVPME